MASNALIATQPLPIVQTDDGPVTATTIEHLEELLGAARQQADNVATDLKAEETAALDLRAKAGWLLASQPDQSTLIDRASRIEAALGLGRLVATLESSLAEVKARPHHGLGGFIHAAQDSRAAHDLESKLTSAQAEMVARYRSVVEGLEPPTGLPEADVLLRQASEHDGRVDQLKSQFQQTSIDVDRLSDEVKRRKEIISSLGFDALGVQADLQINGLRPIATDLVLKPHEVAVATSKATLCRHRTRTQYVGGSQGFSVPLGHGFRYRVSSYRGHPVETDVLAQVDDGTLTVTNQRLVFIGSKRDVAIPIAKLLQVETFSNGIGIGREGKETRDIYLLSRPAYIAMFIQWVVAHPEDSKKPA